MLKKIPFLYNFGLKLKHKFLTIKTKKELNLYIKEYDKKALQLGTGHNFLNDWFNTDYFPRNKIFFLDVTKSFPIPSDSFDFVFSEHQIEHIHYREARFMLKEVYRLLKKGGVLRICTPNLKAYLSSYFKNQETEDPYIKDITDNWIKTGFHNAKNYIPSLNQENVSFFVNDVFYNYEHKFIFDSDTLINLLVEAGFSKVVQVPPAISEFKDLNDIESHNGDSIPFTLALEAVK
ncbi:class I SAM-dependent methyltransferase [Pedobacter agri]|uniref:class I SAM-dependent methyltransferase n=1 Tax=Pedobacter agri TaxID=454586 RepID=UPI00292CB9D6|nr:methyltransferase domain-containing protein [Pedobacter agri]